MASNDHGVPRGDNVGSEQDKADSIERQEAGSRGEGVAADAASRTDRSGENSTPEPDGSKGSDRGGTAGWGAAPSGGSVIDKRGPDKS